MNEYSVVRQLEAELKIPWVGGGVKKNPSTTVVVHPFWSVATLQIYERSLTAYSERVSESISRTSDSVISSSGNARLFWASRLVRISEALREQELLHHVLAQKDHTVIFAVPYSGKVRAGNDSAIVTYTMRQLLGETIGQHPELNSNCYFAPTSVTRGGFFVDGFTSGLLYPITTNSSMFSRQKVSLEQETSDTVSLFGTFGDACVKQSAFTLGVLGKRVNVYVKDCPIERIAFKSRGEEYLRATYAAFDAQNIGIFKRPIMPNIRFKKSVL